MKKRNLIYLISVPGIVMPFSYGHADVYFTAEQARQVIFPGASFTAYPLTLTDDQRKAIKKKSGVPVRLKEQKIWKASTGGFLIVDEVLGKHEFITYAVGILPDGSVKQIEIMDYRESYGYEVRNENWRKQFHGKNAASRLELGKDIKNISGATLSCRHVTDGVKRILAMYELLLQ
jgi:Na+-translocating ferredoxin:NAD+ oxidoreductase RnfG subunit